MLVIGLSFAIPKFLVSNYIGPMLVDVISALVCMVCMVCLVGLLVMLQAYVWPFTAMVVG